MKQPVKPEHNVVKPEKTINRRLLFMCHLFVSAGKRALHCTRLDSAGFDLFFYAPSTPVIVWKVKGVGRAVLFEGRNKLKYRKRKMRSPGIVQFPKTGVLPF